MLPRQPYTRAGTWYAVDSTGHADAECTRTIIEAVGDERDNFIVDVFETGSKLAPELIWRRSGFSLHRICGEP